MTDIEIDIEICGPAFRVTTVGLTEALCSFLVAGVPGSWDTDRSLRRIKMQPKIGVPAHVSLSEKRRGLGLRLWTTGQNLCL